MQCKFSGHDFENFLGLCFNQSCLIEPLFCYFCKEEQHSNHMKDCIRFDVLNKSIVNTHNTLLQVQNHLRECQKQISTCFRNLLDSNFSQKMDECQQLHKILQSKNYEEAKANTNMLWQYYSFNIEKLRLYANRIQCISDEFINQLNQLSIIDQNDELSQPYIVDDSKNNSQFQSEGYFKGVIQEQKQICQREQQQNVMDDDEALLQLVLKESQEEDYFQNIQKSDEILNQAKQNLSNHNYAMPLIEQSISLNNQNDEAFFIKAKLLLLQENEEEAMKYFKQTIDINPFNIKANIELGKANIKFQAELLFRQSKFDQAEKVYFEAIQKNPHFSPLYSNRATVLCRLNKYNEAIEMSNKAIELDSLNASAYNNKATALVRLHKLEEALQNYDTALKIDENNSDFLANKGSLLLEMKKLKEAQTCQDKIDQLGQNNPHIFYFKCEILMVQSKFYEAFEKCQQGLSFYPNHRDLQSLKVLLENIIQKIR